MERLNQENTNNASKEIQRSFIPKWVRPHILAGRLFLAATIGLGGIACNPYYDGGYAQRAVDQYGNKLCELKKPGDLNDILLIDGRRIRILTERDLANKLYYTKIFLYDVDSPADTPKSYYNGNAYIGKPGLLDADHLMFIEEDRFNNYRENLIVRDLNSPKWSKQNIAGLCQDK